LTSLRFFGLGNGSSADDRSTYLLRDTRVRGALWINPRGLLSFGVESGFLRVETGPGKAGRSLETVFDPAEVTGFGVPRTEYSVVGGWAEFDVREKSVDPAVGVVARITALRYDDRDLNLFDFTRLVGDVKVYIPLGHRNRIFALRFRTSHSTADRGDQVPFYLMETLGGPTTIRGFRQYRFRDTRNLLLNVEYRWEVWTYLDFSFFFDAGKVFSDEDDFDFSGLHTGYGFGMRAHAPGDVRFRIDLARSREGFKLHIGGGPSF
ncbi:MAG: BamA/TamA family outer membrane protein, partial [Acidobacteriota bacterium]